MAVQPARRMNVPLRHVALLCGIVLFLVLGKVSHIQVLRAGALGADPRDRRSELDRFDRPRGEILLRDGSVVATSRHVTGPFRFQRVYPGGAVFAPVTGHVSLYGARGLEQAQDAVLAGTDAGVQVRAVLAIGVPAAATIRLTIDGRAQRAAYEALRATGRRGAAVALDPATGAILALASHPSYDPNLYGTLDLGRLDAVDARLQRDPGRPLLNRALNQSYPPGSTFKIVTTAAALGAGAYLPTSVVSAPAALRLPATTVHLRNFGGRSCGDGMPTLADAFVLSCNTAFARIGMDLGQEALREQAGRFGFDADDLRVPLPVSRSAYPVEMDAAQTAMSAIGQYSDRVTPLMVAMMSAAVANGGSLMRPYLVEQVLLPDGRVIGEAEPERYRQVMSEDVAGALTEMMLGVTRPGGTGAAGAIPGIDVAAKTGTAENAAGAADHALFSAFAPVTATRGTQTVAVGVVVEGGGRGGTVAGPVARAILTALLS
jgi:peptidoglycan glycosyltransferase